MQKLKKYLKNYKYNSNFVLLLHNPYFITKKILKDKLSKVIRNIKGEVIIDLGCGQQPYQDFCRNFKTYVGIDLTATSNPDIIASIEKIPLRENMANAVLCSEVLEHVKEPKSVFQEMYRILKSDGHLFLTAPMSWNLHHEPNDYWRFTRYGLVYLANTVGFKVESTVRLGGLVSLIGARITDVIQLKIQRVPFINRMSARKYFATIVVLPLNLIFYFMGKLFDGIDKSDAFGWMIVAKK